jgi:ketosteroid isomerase-like protein
VVVVDDHAPVRTAAQGILEGDGIRVVGVAATADDPGLDGLLIPASGSTPEGPRSKLPSCSHPAGDRGGTMDVRAWLEAYRRAWEEADADAAAALFEEDATYRSNIFQEPHHGREGVRRYWQDVTRTQEDVRVRMGRPFADGSRVAAEFWTTMRADGDDLTLAGCLLLDFGDDGRCTALREYWHIEPGEREPPPGWGT